MTSSHLGSQAIGDDALWFHGLSRDAVLYRLEAEVYAELNVQNWAVRQCPLLAQSRTRKEAELNMLQGRSSGHPTVCRPIVHQDAALCECVSSTIGELS